MVNHRRISLSDIEAPETIESQPPPPLPPQYFEYKPGGREEFFRDLEAYQAAAQIHAQHMKTAPSPIEAPVEAPSYDSIGEVLPTIHETKVFKRRLLDTLRGIRNFTERRRLAPKWSNCFGFSDKVQIGLAALLFLALGAGIAALAVSYQQIAGLLAMCLFFLVHTGCTFFVIRKYLLKRRLIEALQIGLGKVERFEKIDDETLAKIKKGVDAILNPLFWIQSERRMEEAIPDELRVPTSAPPPPQIESPPPLPTESPPPPPALPMPVARLEVSAHGSS